jgi:hypothetical protein
MEISQAGSLSSALSPAQVGDQASALIIKKAIDIKAQTATQLLETLPPIANNPPNLGNSVDVKA